MSKYLREALSKGADATVEKIIDAQDRAVDSLAQAGTALEESKSKSEEYSAEEY